MSQPNLPPAEQTTTKKEPLIGAHISMSGGFHKLSERMDKIGATCCAFFLKNQRQFNGKPIDVKDMEIFRSQYFDEEIENDGIRRKKIRVEKETGEGNQIEGRGTNQRDLIVNCIKQTGYQSEENESEQQKTEKYGLKEEKLLQKTQGHNANKHDSDEKQSKKHIAGEHELKEKTQEHKADKHYSDENELNVGIKEKQPEPNTVFIKNESENGKEKEYSDQSLIPIFKRNRKDINILVPHASYLINMANATEKRESHLLCFFDELKRCKLLGIKYLNIHPGSDISKVGIEKASQLIADAINEGHKRNTSVTILLENMAGQGRVLCSRFEEIKKIIDKVKDKERIGVCIDTAHLFGAGHDIRTKEKYENVINQIDQIIGLQYVKAMHLNDSLVDLNSKKDRHAQIGCGRIGKDAFKFIMRDKRFVDIPKILETPDETKYAQEIAMLKKYAKE